MRRVGAVVSDVRNPVVQPVPPDWKTSERGFEKIEADGGFSVNFGGKSGHHLIRFSSPIRKNMRLAVVCIKRILEGHLHFSPLSVLGSGRVAGHRNPSNKGHGTSPDGLPKHPDQLLGTGSFQKGNK